MEKIILTQEQHKAIEDLRINKFWTLGNILEKQKMGWNTFGEYDCLNSLSHDEMVRILTVPDSYVVEKPEGEKATHNLEKSLGILTDVAQGLIKSLSDVGEKIHKNMQANITELDLRGVKLSNELIAELQKGEMVLSFKDFIQEKAVEGSEKMLEQSIMNGFSEKEQEHLNNPFYKKVDEITEKVAVQQILKGAEKYDEPFNPASWTGEQLVNHGLQEARDLQVYLVGLKEHIERLEEDKKFLQSSIDSLHYANKMLKLDNQNLRYCISEKDTEIEILKEELKNWKLSHG